ncbi:MAG: hypothetical protein BMS9Abin26_2124 [Gammaproteobacteria bacterium]|nr:MAG: hypothetical protein BMS9Abin26_2124 [Gammaproteobacteria bacterium]
MKFSLSQHKGGSGLVCRIYKNLLSYFFITLLVFTSTSALAEATPSLEPVAGIPLGASIVEDDILVRDEQIEGAPSGPYWSSGVVPYVFSSNVSAANRTLMIAAMQLWENIGNIDFRPRNGESDYLFIQNATTNDSYVGPVGGSQVVNIASWNTQVVILHELGHALGWWHEQQRSDRGTYVTILASLPNVNYDIKTTDTFSPYDYDSLMHYGPGNIDTKAPYNAQNISWVNQAVGPNGQCFTNPVPATTWETGIGQRTHMSHWDCRMMSFNYPEANWRFVLPSRTSFIQVGLYTFPWDTLVEGLTTPAGGTLWIDGGSYPALTINQNILLLAPRGTVTIN